MFGYLNLGNPKLIGKFESQEAINCRVDQGRLEFAQWSTAANGREVSLSSLIVEGRVYDTGVYPLHDVVRWNYSSVVGDKLGMAVPAQLPSIAADTYGFNPYPTGTYTYALTLYNPDTGEESSPATLTVTIASNQIAKFSNFPSYAAMYPKKINLVWRLYRRPLTAGVFQLVGSLGSAMAGISEYKDIIADDAIGESCASIGNLTLFETSADLATSIAWFDQRLWVATGSIVRFSKTDMPWAFPTINQFGFGDIVTGIIPFRETMIVTLASKKPRIIYGDDQSNFTEKELDAEIGVATNSGRIVAGNLLMAAIEDRMLLLPTDTGKAIVSLDIFDGARPVNISSNVRGLFPKMAYADLTHGSVNEPRTGIVENRFYVLELNSTRLPMALQSEFITDSFFLIYDVYTKGFLRGDSVATFRYRTREFSVPPKAKQLKTVFVETSGSVTVEIYLNNILATSMQFNNVVRKVNVFKVKPWGCDSFSFRFIGQPASMVYSYGVDDPLVAIGNPPNRNEAAALIQEG
ncbi:MAG: hypothetical protein HQM09_15205 [Candidatus Riflebacteria bacterium]|nr:hypothetical protein [Candidatus Riflebacteria bacterium]